MLHILTACTGLPRCSQKRRRWLASKKNRDSITFQNESSHPKRVHMTPLLDVEQGRESHDMKASSQRSVFRSINLCKGHLAKKRCAREDNGMQGAISIEQALHDCVTWSVAA